MKRFDVGTRVHEPTYGHGSVISVEDAFTRIQFDDSTARKFLTSLAKIELSSEPAPAKRPRARKAKAKKTAGATAAKSAAKKTAGATAAKSAVKKTVKATKKSAVKKTVKATKKA